MDKLVNMYSIFDKVTGRFNAPFLSINDKSAYRELMFFLVKNPQINIDDVELWKLGNLNVESGVISSDKYIVEVNNG